MNEPPKEGELFSRLYIERGTPLPDSNRFRVRLYQYYWDYLRKDHDEVIRKAIPRELGAEVPYIANWGYSVGDFFKQAVITDVLGAITLIHRALLKLNYKTGNNEPTYQSTEWQAFVRRAFQEENLAYTLDEWCGVHPLVDAEFERNIAATLAGLGASRYAAARTAVEAMEAKFEQTPPDTKGAIRDAFEAVETLTKIITCSGKALDAGFVKSEIMPRVQTLYQSDQAAKLSGASAAQSLADWVNAAHPYRHGQNTEEPIAPPEELAILLVSQGASFIRWLVDLDRLLNGKVA